MSVANNQKLALVGWLQPWSIPAPVDAGFEQGDQQHLIYGLQSPEWTAAAVVTVGTGEGFYPSGFGLSVGPMTVAPGPSAFPEAFVDALNAPDGNGQYLVEISAYVGGEARSGGLATLTEIPLTTIPEGGGTSVGQVTLRYADRHWVGDPDDADHPNVFFEGRVDVPLDITRAMPILPEEDRRVRRQIGEIEIANGDGGLDAILQSYAVDGRRVRVLFGPYMGDYADFRAVLDVLGTGWEGESTRVRISLRDRSYSLDLPLQETLYAGTGGAEGTDELKGKPKPLNFGRTRNITPVLIDPANLIYHWHDGESFALDDVFDRGATLTDSGDDVASYAALVSQGVSPGEYATSLAVSMFKLGGLPSGLVTCDTRGDSDPSYINTLDLIALRILKDRHGLSPMWIDTASFAGAASIAGEMGIYINPNETPTTAEVVTRLMGAVGAWWGSGRDGRIRAGRLGAPENRSPNLRLDQYDILSLAPDTTPVPRWRQRVGYKPNWTVQRGEDLATSVTASRRQFLTEPYSVVTASDAVTRIRHLQALDPPPLVGLYENEADADTLADYLHDLHSPDRRLYRAAVKRVGYRLDLQKITHVTWPRYGMHNGKNLAVVGMTERADRRGDVVELRLWG